MIMTMGGGVDRRKYLLHIVEISIFIHSAYSVLYIVMISTVHVVKCDKVVIFGEEG